MLYRGGVKSQPYLEEDATSFHWTEFLINSQPSQSGQPAIVASGQERVRTPGNPRASVLTIYTFLGRKVPSERGWPKKTPTPWKMRPFHRLKAGTRAPAMALT